jgi:hypothetical protein
MANKSLQQIPEDAAAAAGIGIPDPTGSITVVSLASNDDPDLLAQSLDINTSGCTEFTMTIEGQTVSVTMEELPIDPVGGETVSFLMTQVLPTGQTMYIMGVMAREGATAASAQHIGTTEPDLVTQDELGRLTGELLIGRPATG